MSPSAPSDRPPVARAPCPPLPRAEALRVLRHLLAHQPGCFADGPPALAELGEDRRIDPGDLGADSLARLQLAQHAADLFDLRRRGTADLLLARRRLGDWVDLAAPAWADGPAAVSFHSAGSQGAPKRVTHAAWRLWAEARLLARRLAGRRRVVSLVPAHHIYGFIWTVLLPRVLDAGLLDLAGDGPGALAGRLAPGDLVVGVPAQWAFLASALDQVPPDVVAASSTAPLDPDTARALLAHAGLARVVEAFGSSETAGIGIRDDPDAPFELLETWTAPSGGSGDDARLVRRDDGAEIAAPDRLVWHGPRHLWPAGRRDGAVTIGGATVHPEAVARRLGEVPGVAEARVRPADGRLKALVVPEAGQDAEALRRAVRAWAERNLAPAERPLRIAAAARVPTDALGKELDWEAADGSLLSKAEPEPRDR